jgi:hypothetical protein
LVFQLQGWLKVAGLQVELVAWLQLSVFWVESSMQLASALLQAELDCSHASRQTSHLLAGSQ